MSSALCTCMYVAVVLLAGLKLFVLSWTNAQCLPGEVFVFVFEFMRGLNPPRKLTTPYSTCDLVPMPS